MQIKPGVHLDKLTPQMCLAAIIVDKCYTRIAQECTITSASDGAHMPGSLHAAGNAIDFRTKSVTQTSVQLLVQRIRMALGAQYDVVLEDDHLHVEFDPKSDPTFAAIHT